LKTEVTNVEDEKNVVMLKVEVPAEKVMPSIDKAYREVSKKVRIPGFRKGKVPPRIIDQMVGEDAVMDEALNDLIPLFYPEAIESSGIEPVSQPKVDVEQIEKDKPFIFTAKVELKPEVKLGDYKVIKLPKVATKASKKEIDEHIDKIRDRFSELKPVKRAVKDGDYVLLDFEGFLDGKPFDGGSASDDMLEIGSESFIPGFEEQIIGAKAGEERDIDVTFPKNYHSKDLAEKDVVFHITIKEIKTKKLPKLDDDFAKNVSKFDTLEEMKADVKKELETRKEKEQEATKRDGAIDYVTEDASIDIPQGMVEQQINSLSEEFNNILKREKTDLESYLKEQGDTFQGFREQFREEAEKRVKTNLVLEEVMKKEKIEASDDDIDEELNRLSEKSDQKIDEIKAEMTEEHFDYLRSQLSMMKTVDYLISKVKFVKPEEIEKKPAKDSEKEKEKIEKKGKKEEEIVEERPVDPDMDFSDIAKDFEVDQQEQKAEKGDDEQ